MSMRAWDPADEAERNEQLLDDNQPPVARECRGCGEAAPPWCDWCDACAKEHGYGE